MATGRGDDRLPGYETPKDMARKSFDRRSLMLCL